MFTRMEPIYFINQIKSIIRPVISCYALLRNYGDGQLFVLLPLITQRETKQHW
jgi:hypothetical protein